MQIDFYEGWFLATCRFEQRHVLRDAGFTFDTTIRQWVTADPTIAARMPISALNMEAKIALGLTVETLPVPDGLEYLPFQDEGIRYALSHRDSLIADQPGLGKGHPVSTLVLTPTGWTPIGDVEVGDQLIGWHGEPVRVSRVFNRGVLPVYRVTLSDGVSIPCDGDHLWQLYTPAGQKRLMATTDLWFAVGEGAELEVPTLMAPVEHRAQTLPMSPMSAGVEFATAYGIKRGRRQFAFPEIWKIDPLPYRFGSPAQRIEFLRGVTQSIGVVRDGALRVDLFDTEQNKPLVTTIIDVVRSLGGLAYSDRVYDKMARRRLTIHLPHSVALPVFGYATERERMSKRWKAFEPGLPARRVISVELVGRDDVVCLSIASEDKLYVTEGYTLTHNTVQGIGFVNALPNARRGLIIPPASLKKNWLKEWKRWTTRHDLSIDISTSKEFPNSDVVILNPEQLRVHHDRLRSEVWDFMITDEAHYYKNKDSKRKMYLMGGSYREGKGWKKSTVNIRKIPAVRNLYLTGTPITKQPIDIFTLCEACDPHGLGRDFETFAYDFCGAYTDSFGNLDFSQPDHDTLARLNHALHDAFMIRRLKKDVLKDLPEKVRQIVPLPADGLKKKMKEEKDAILALLDAYEQMNGIQKNMSQDDLVQAILNVSPATWERYAEQSRKSGKNHMADLPLNRLAVARQELAIAKVPMVAEFVQSLLDQGEPVVLFAYHQAVIEALSEAFPDFSVVYGKTPMDKRQDIVDEFQENHSRRGIIGQYTAAGVGYTMIRAHHWVGAEMVWVPHELLQAEDRIHRIGTTETCWCHHLVVEDSLDDSMVMKLVTRMDTIERALD